MNRMQKTFVSSLLPAATLLAGIAQAGDISHFQLPQPTYRLTRLDSLGGTSSVGASINDLGWVAGRSNLLVGNTRHAALWRNGSVKDLGTLGSPDKTSTVLWPVKNLRGIISGISYSDEPDLAQESWSCGAFIASSGTRCFGFRWESGVMSALRPFPGGMHSFATGTNNFRQTVGWAENGVLDDTCTGTQKLQFRAVIWGANGKIVRELPPLPGKDANGVRDTSTAATAINDRGQVVGISGICDQAVGRFTAKHNVLWQNGKPVNIGDFGGIAWNTPMMINQRGDIVGFANASAADGGNLNPRAFLKVPGQPIRQLDPLDGHATSQATGINEWRQVVGQSCSLDDSDCRAFLWQGGNTLDLNAIVDDDEDLLTTANDIDDFGRITGQGFDDEAGKFFAFVATPAW